jgi:hypothetical protein
MGTQGSGWEDRGPLGMDRGTWETALSQVPSFG